MEKLKPAGGTAIFDALHQAMALRPEKSDRPYVVVFITDGMPTVGETNDDAIVAETDKAADAGHARLLLRPGHRRERAPARPHRGAHARGRAITFCRTRTSR